MKKLLIGVALASLTVLPCLAQSYTDPDPNIRSMLVRDAASRGYVAKGQASKAVKPAVVGRDQFGGAYAQQIDQGKQHRPEQVLVLDPDPNIRASLRREDTEHYFLPSDDELFGAGNVRTYRVR